jgi:hypothetical protein
MVPPVVYAEQQSDGSQVAGLSVKSKPARFGIEWVL